MVFILIRVVQEHAQARCSIILCFKRGSVTVLDGASEDGLQCVERRFA